MSPVLTVTASELMAAGVPSTLANEAVAAMKPLALGSGRTYYVATTGRDSNDGLSLNRPFATVGKAVSAARAGDTIYVRGGTYRITSTIGPSRSGTATNRITLKNYNNEKVTLEGSGLSDGTKILRWSNVSYWTISGINVTKAGGIGISFMDNAHHNRLENLESHHNRGPGVAVERGAYQNQIVRVKSYFNYDSQDKGENADGFAPKFDSRDNVFVYCEAYNNSDDGWDSWDAGRFLAMYCIAHHNGLDANGRAISPDGDGNGFKLGGGNNSGNNFLIYCVSYLNLSRGFDWNDATARNTLINCTAYDNQGVNYRLQNATIKNSISYGSSNSISSSTQQNNSWTLNISDPRFASTNPAAPNFLYLSANSPALNRGTRTGLKFTGTAPDLGAFEYGAEWRGGVTSPDPTPNPTPNPPPTPTPAPVRPATLIVGPAEVTVSYPNGRIVLLSDAAETELMNFLKKYSL